jgi:hypothetical protein
LRAGKFIADPSILGQVYLESRIVKVVSDVESWYWAYSSGCGCGKVGMPGRVDKREVEVGPFVELARCPKNRSPEQSGSSELALMSDDFGS